MPTSDQLLKYTTLPILTPSDYLQHTSRLQNYENLSFYIKLYVNKKNRFQSCFIQDFQ